MRSSKSFSSRSHTTKYSLRDSINCPLRENSSRQSFLPSKNLPKKVKYSQYSLRQYVECKSHGQSIDFLTVKDSECVMSDKAINYINQGSPEASIQFIGLMGRQESVAQFMRLVYDLSSFDKEEGFQQPKLNRQHAGISIYMFRLYKGNKITYFLQPNQSIEKNLNEDTIFKIIIRLCQSIIIFPAQNPNEELKNFAHKIYQLKQQQQKYKEFNLFPSTCYQIFHKQIVCLQQTLQLFQSIFSIVTIGSIDEKASITQDLSMLNQRNHEAVFNIINQIRQAKLERDNLHKNLSFVELIIEYCFQKEHHQLQDYSLNSIHPLVGKFYNSLICRAQHEYEQFLNKLNYHTIDFQDQLLDYFYQQQSKILRKFQQARYHEIHQLYLQKLCNFISNFELKMLQNYRNFKTNESFENLSFCEESSIHSQLNCPQQIIKSIDDLKRGLISEDYKERNLKEQIFILVRDASRLHIFGYDQKIRIAQLRQQIDYNWQILQQIQLQNQNKLLQPTQQNLHRQKYRNLQQRLTNLNDKFIFLESILPNVFKQNNELKNIFQMKDNQYKQLQALKTKNEILLECIQSSADSNAVAIQQKILQIKVNSSLAQSKKQLLISSMQNIISK